MNDPFRLRVMKALTAQIKTVKPANGYRHNLADFTDKANRTMERVYRGRALFGESHELPLVAILEDPRALEVQNATAAPVAMTQLRLLIQGFVKDERPNQLDPAYVMSAEVISALVKAKEDEFDILGMNGKVTDMQIGQPVHRPDDEISDTAYFVVGVTLTLAENLETPFA